MTQYKLEYLKRSLYLSKKNDERQFTQNGNGNYRYPTHSMRTHGGISKTT
ncbi:hypothetical protein LEP1GSC036_2609 [Leptospira weilii str. 2006001853]|uniref:Uncharacterized protein n=1 Tax=Leptospira weilii str. 2006001853 TaxID=1001589 RepID=A0A828Z466_9LEPT|nr:hypothetical protein LEP1GSC036_2609 [Leptospira weilii str. 2006001853]